MTDHELTAEQRRRVRDSFELLREYAAPLSLLFYGKLFELDPGARKLFHNDLALQGKKLMDMLSSVVESLDNFEKIRATVTELGRKHAEIGVRTDQYEVVTTALLWAIAQALGADFDPETREAWRLSIKSLTAAMQAGAQAGSVPQTS
jgi:nitric oxide dioxygenase